MIKKLLLSCMLLSMPVYLPAHPGCAAGGTPTATAPSWINNNWQGILFAMVVLGPLQQFWNELGSSYLRSWVKKQWGVAAPDAKHGHHHDDDDCCHTHEISHD